MKPRSRAAVSFLVSVACDAAEAVLERRWSDVCEREESQELAPLASAFGLLPAAGRAAARLSGSRYGPAHARPLAILGAAMTARTAAVLALVKDLLGDSRIRATSPIVVKGVGLTLGGLYRDERFFVDADLVVAESSIPVWREVAEERALAFQPGAPGGYEVAYISDGNALIELHVALAGHAGREHGPSYADVLEQSAEIPAMGGGIMAPSAEAAREIAVHHFVFHHGGDPMHALRALQDLHRLESAGAGGQGLHWGAVSPVHAVDALRYVARAAHEGRDEEDREARLFFDSLFSVSGESGFSFEFSSNVDRWLGSESGLGARAAIIGRRLFPSVNEMRKHEAEARVVTAARYIARPARLIGRYGAGLLKRYSRPRAARRVRAWRRVVESLIGSIPVR